MSVYGFQLFKSSIVAVPPFYTAMTNCFGAHNRSAPAADPEDEKMHCAAMGCQGCKALLAGSRPGTKKANMNVSTETFQDLINFQSAPQYHLAQGMVLSLTKEAAAQLYRLCKDNEDALDFYTSVQGFYYEIVKDRNNIGVYKQEVLEDVGGRRGTHGFFMYWDDDEEFGGWYLSKGQWADGNGAKQAGYAGIAGWFGKLSGDMGAPLHMPFDAPTPLPGVKIVPWLGPPQKGCLMERISCVLLELGARGASIIYIYIYS
jgi:hypothetical protein